MNKRNATILEAAIREFIDAGEPVSSGTLYEKYDFGIKPAMIRLVLNDLEEEGYLQQPHHSAGRVPTDAGYEFFARRMLEISGASCDRRMEDNFLHCRWDELLEEMTAQLGAFGVARVWDEGETYKEGLHELVSRAAWESRDELNQIIEDFEEIEERLERLHDKVFNASSVRFFIGRKSPLTESGELAVAAADYRVGGERVSLVIVGPKRMDYRKVARMCKGLQRVANGD